MLLSCAPKRAPIALSLDEVEPYEGPVTVDVLKERLVLGDIGTLRAEVRVRAKMGKKNLGNYKGALVFERPSSLRLRVYGAFGTPGMEVVHSMGTIQVYVPQDRVLYEGRSPAEPEELTYTIRDNGKEYVLFVLGEDGDLVRLHATYIFDRSTLLNKEINFFREGERFLRMRFARYSGGVPLLSQMDLFNGYSARIELLEPETGVELAPGLFELVPHDGVRVLPLERMLKEGV